MRSSFNEEETNEKYGEATAKNNEQKKNHAYTSLCDGHNRAPESISFLLFYLFNFFFIQLYALTQDYEFMKNKPVKHGNT